MKNTLLSILLLIASILQSQTYQVFNKSQESISFDLLTSQLKDVDVYFLVRYMMTALGIWHN